MEKKKGFKTFLKDLKNDEIRGVIAFFGDEKFLIDWAFRELVKKYINPATYEMDMEKVDFDQSDFSKIEASYLTMPFFSEKRVILLEGLSGKHVDEVANLSDTESQSILVVLCNSKDDKILNKVTSYEFPSLNRAELISFVEKRFKNNELMIPRAISSKIAEESGYLNKDNDYDLYNMEGDLLKIISYAESYGEDITMDLIREIMSESLDNNVFKLIDAIGSKRKDRAFDQLRDLSHLGINPLTILATIINHCEAMLQIKELVENGFSKDKIEKMTKIKSFRIEKLLGITRSYEVDNIQNMLIKAYETDTTIKKSLIQPSFALEMLIGSM